jgi:oligopeptide/dipeptide ABC transporter ATP-binding protein
VLESLAGLQRRHGLALLLVSHDLVSLAALTDRIAVLYAGRLIEEGPTAALRARPAHPYTRGLLAALPPTLESEPGRPRPIPGAPPGPGPRPPGCAFEPRCGDRLARCAEAQPSPSTPEPGRRVHCFLHEPDA